MNYDYDLVIIGQRPAAIAAAELAATWGARVALVMSPDRSPDTVATAHLAIAGIDLIRGVYQFVPRFRRRRRSVIIGMGLRNSVDQMDLQIHEPERNHRSRILRSRRYVLAPDARATVPQCSGLDRTPHVLIGNRTDIRRWLAQLDDQAIDEQPRRAIVYGGRSLVSLELAMMLLDSGLETRLITADSALLASEGDTETDAASLIRIWQLQAIANGLNCELNQAIVNVQPLGRELVVQTKTEKFTTDVLLIADRLMPDLDRRNLQTCGLTFSGEHLWVDRGLRTSHPQIYACAAALRGHDAESIATHEALIATRNTLTPWIAQAPNYRAISWGIVARFGLARVGLNLEQAKGLHSDAIAIDLSVQAPTGHDQLPRRDHNSPIAAQVVLSAAGTILGATIIGDRAADLIVPFSWMIGQSASIDDWQTGSGLDSIAGVLSDQLYQTWRDRWWQSHPGWRDRVRSWFDDQRG
ncbi:MAG: NAD(P)/FAD-dependent oxidoreductase [Coleofasciculaceae cyanobacterium RL_1_1]|nr:NAD(P)/FAD-dependent oxidoreductase [Coleofasciculaceae cyanobacterium RL_1_1]